MILRAVTPALILLALATAPLAGQDGKASEKQPAFERFKLLAGEWVGKLQGKDGPDIHVRYKVTAGGSAVVETLFPGTAHEMVSAIHPDGPDLLLTHYCHLGNQPQMRAPGQAGGRTVAFTFVRATNLKSDKDKHMHQAAYTFVGQDTLRSEWTLYNGGKPAGRVVLVLRRQK
jgi:hypothetical protein